MLRRKTPRGAAGLPQPDEDAAFENLIRYIQESRGIDFRGYKRTSLRRRITLRMEHLHVETFVDYHAFLEAHPQEFIDLLNTVLINVTSFFRDPDAWDALKTQVLPQLVAQAATATSCACGASDAPPARNPIRSPCCSASNSAPSNSPAA